MLVPAVGGGFGLKVHLYVEEAILPLLSRLVGAPVKWVEDRYEHLAAERPLEGGGLRARAGDDDDGTLLGVPRPASSATAARTGASVDEPDRPALRGRDAARHLRASTPSRYEVDAAATNKCPTTAYRGVGWTSGQAAREALIDDAARELGIDPLELRLRNCLPDGEPVVSADRLPLRRRQLRRVDPAGARAGRLRRLPRTAAATPGGGTLRRRRLQPVRRAGRLGRARSRPTRAFPARATSTPSADGRAGRVGHAGHRAPVERAGARDDAGAGRRGRPRRPARGRPRRPGRHGRRRVLDGELGQPHRADRGRGGHPRGRRRARRSCCGSRRDELEAHRGDLRSRTAWSRCSARRTGRLTVAEVAGGGLRGRVPARARPDAHRDAQLRPPATYSNACIACVVEVDAETGAVESSGSWPSRTAEPCSTR